MHLSCAIGRPADIRHRDRAARRPWNCSPFSERTHQRKRFRMSTKNGIATASAGIAGALLMYLFDSRLGARRRAILRDKIAHFSRLGRRAAGITARDAIHRAEGAWAEASHMFKRETVPD